MKTKDSLCLIRDIKDHDAGMMGDKEFKRCCKQHLPFYVFGRIEFVIYMGILILLSHVGVLILNFWR
jgi:hypothetical protein